MGYYVLIEFEVDIDKKPGILNSLELKYRKDDNILTCITFNITDKEK